MHILTCQICGKCTGNGIYRHFNSEHGVEIFTCQSHECMEVAERRLEGTVETCETEFKYIEPIEWRNT